MENKTNETKRVTDRLLKKSKELREKSKVTETKFNELKAQLEEFIHPDKEKQHKDTP